jgi:hypothetical protein
MKVFGRIRFFLANARINVFFVKNLIINNSGAVARSSGTQGEMAHVSPSPRVEIRLLDPVRSDRPSASNQPGTHWKDTIAQVNRLNERNRR